MRINSMSSKSFPPSWLLLSLWLAVPSARAFNNDVHTDIVIHNNSTGLNTVLTMNTTNYPGQLPIAQNVGGLNCKIVASGDFNRDLHPDLLWRDDTTGQNVIWLMVGNTVVSKQPITTGDPNFYVVGTGDFNGDG